MALTATRRCRWLPLLCLVVAVSCAEAEEVVELYDRTGVPAIPDRSASIDGIAGTSVTVEALADGTYWATIIEPDSTTVTITLAAMVAGPTCVAELGEAACTDGLGLVGGGDAASTATLVVEPSDLNNVASCSVVDAQRRNYAVTVDELLRLAGEGQPSSAAPDTYRWIDAPFLVSIRSGSLTALRQVWIG